MDAYRSVRNSLIRVALIGGLANLLRGCGPDAPQEVRGTIGKRLRSDGWYQISLENHTLDQGAYGPTVDVRFSGLDVDINRIERELTFGKEVTIRGKKARRDNYEWEPLSLTSYTLGS